MEHHSLLKAAMDPLWKWIFSWAELIKSNRMRDDNLWSCDAEKSKSWAWQSLLQLRPLALCFIHAKVGDGRMISFWWDVWTPFDQLIEHIWHGGPRSLAVPLHSSVSEACTPSGWALRGARSHAASSVPHNNSSAFDSNHKWLVCLACWWCFTGQILSKSHKGGCAPRSFDSTLVLPCLVQRCHTKTLIPNVVNSSW